MQTTRTLPVAFGCLKLADKKNSNYLDNCAEVLADAMKNGYRVFDFASAYGTHKAYPLALKKVGGDFDAEVHSKITLKDINDKGCKGAVQSVLDELEVESLDVLYLHAPDAISKKTLDQLQTLKKEKMIKKIGLSNVNLSQLQGLEQKGCLPDYVQVEISPRCYDEKLIQYCKEKEITLVGYRPLGESSLLKVEELTKIAGDLSKNRTITTAQVIHRWCIQNGIIPLTKAGAPNHQQENRSIYDFSLTSNQMEKINGLKKTYGELRTCKWEKFVKPGDLEKVNNWIDKGE